MDIKDKVLQAFQDQFGEAPNWITRSPGRVNIIGEHTDYNEGFVLPMAISYDTRVALRPRSDTVVSLTALDKGQRMEYDLTDYSKGLGGWREYVTGVSWALQEEGWELVGWEGVVTGDVPIGAGLSSSAALELALARAFALAGDQEWEPRQIALACRKAENQWVGVNSGIMDQLVSACGKKDFAQLIDCRSLSTRQVPLPSGTSFLILDTATRRGLVDSLYNERRAQCEALACHFGADTLRDVSIDMLLDKAGILDLELYQRAQHVISENQRVLEAANAMENKDQGRLGELMNQSHASLRDDFQVSREELDLIVSIAQKQPGCYGARMTGAGFGGCAVALVEYGQVDEFTEQLSRKYLRKTGLEPTIYQTKAEQGTNFEQIS